MVAAPKPAINPDEYSRCEERRRVVSHGPNVSPLQKSDTALRESIYEAIWKDSVLRAIEYDEIDVRTHGGIVHIHGHIVSGANQIRIMNAIRTVPGILGIQSHLVFDDQLILESAISLAGLEHTHDCKFFTGASHGVISMDGTVRDAAVKLLAEKQVAANSKVRGVINRVHIEGSEPDFQNPPFLQPFMGETIYFLDGVSGIVKQVIINPDNRLVIAMTVQWKFADQRHEPVSVARGNARLPGRQVVVPMSAVRYLTKDSGFLFIKSSEGNLYANFDSAVFRPPGWGWTPPHPYCTDDVLFPMERHDTGHPSLQQASQAPFTAMANEKLLREQLLSNDSPGG